MGRLTDGGRRTWELRLVPLVLQARTVLPIRKHNQGVASLKPEFSELSYAYALTENLVHSLGIPLLSAPAFPSTVAEGKKGAGHDLKLSCPGMSIFLQFKLSHCMKNSSAKEFTSGKFKQHVSGVMTPVY